MRAAHDGVGRSRWIGTHGWTFHLNGSGVISRYSHLSVGASAGAYRRGEIIGLCGSTGRWSTGPHLRFEVEPLRLIHRLENPTPDQWRSLEQEPRWAGSSDEASR